MKEILFGAADYFYDPYFNPDSKYFSDRPEKYDALEVATIVFNDIDHQVPLSGKILEYRIDETYGDDAEKFNGKVVYEVEYADDCGYLGCAMEHGDLFAGIPYRSESNH